MGRKHDETNESFLYKVIDYDHKRKVYTLKNRKTGAVIEMPKDDFDNRLIEQKGNMTEGRNG
jgi:hypothetical protein